MNSEFDRGVKNFAVGAGIGIGLGFIAGILLAPKSGRETLTDISKGTRQAAETAKNSLNRVEGKIKNHVESFGGAISSVDRSAIDSVEKGIRKASEAVEETVDVVKEGIDKFVKKAEKLQATN